MKTAVLFNFEVDTSQQKIFVERSWNAPLSMVWDAWTKAEILDQWWAPKPYRNETKAHQFIEGGHWHYKMISPKDEVHWCAFFYEKIDTEKSFSGHDAFCDEEMNINPQFEPMHWTNQFEANGEQTVVRIEIQMPSAEALETIIKMGFKEGFTMGLQNLEELLEAMPSRS